MGGERRVSDDCSCNANRRAPTRTDKRCKQHTNQNLVVSHRVSSGARGALEAMEPSSPSRSTGHSSALHLPSRRSPLCSRRVSRSRMSSPGDPTPSASPCCSSRGTICRTEGGAQWSHGIESRSAVSSPSSARGKRCRDVIIRVQAWPTKTRGMRDRTNQLEASSREGPTSTYRRRAGRLQRWT